MKKSLLLLASLVMSVGAFAQWTKPVPANTQDMSTDGETSQYLYNLGACGFFAGANDWNTRASIATTGDPIMFKVYDGGDYNFCCYPSTKKKWLYVSCNNWDAMWVDAGNDAGNEAYPGTDKWTVTKEGDYYTIANSYSVSVGGGNLGIAECFNGELGNTRCYLYNPEAQIMEDVDDEPVAKGPIMTGDFYDKWVFISAEEYENLQPQVAPYLASERLRVAIAAAKAADASYDYKRFEDVYANTSSTVEEMDSMTAIVNAAASLKRALVAAEAEYADYCDFDPVYAVYNDNTADVEALNAAEKNIKAITGAYEATKASFDEPLEVEIGDGSDIAPWTREFTGTGSTGTWHTNNWSTEANNGGDGTDMTTPFCEDWVASGSKLSDQKIYQDYAASPGLYKLTINTRVYSEAGGIDSFEGIKMFFGNDSINLQDKAVMYKSDSKCVLWTEEYFTIISVIKEASNVQFGFDIQGANFNWLAFKGTSLKYYGNENVDENAAKLAKEAYGFVKADEDTDAKPELIAAYNDAIDAFDAAASLEAVNEAADAVKAAKAELDANVDAYKNLLAAIEKWEKAITDKQDLVGDEWNDFTDFIQIEEEQGLPGYPSVTPQSIVNGDRSLTTEEIEDYITTVDDLYSTAVAHSLQEGSDCTDMIKDANFAAADGEAAGWTVNIKPTNFTWTGGFIPTADAPKAGFPVCESWHSYFDISQTLEGVPDGIYSVSLNGFCRLDDGVDTSVPAEIYMNEFATPLMNILADKMPIDQAADGYNCYLTPAADGPWTTNPIFEGAKSKSPANNADSQDEEGYWPNGMEGASVAFSADRYKAVAYGLVTGGKITLGVRNTKSTHVWALWGNFKLTYEGNSLEALNAVLPVYTEQLSDYVQDPEVANNITKPVMEEALAAVDEGDKAHKEQKVDDMVKALERVNAAIVAAKENVAAVLALNEADTKLGTAVEEYAATATDEAMNAYYDYADKYAKFNAEKNMTTEEVNALASEAESVAKALAMPDPAKASDDNPLDCTGLIVNADFEANTATQQPTGWTVVKGEGAEGNYQVQTGFNGGVSMEFWSNTNGSGTKYDFYQEIADLPAGTYVITADASNSLNDQEAGPGTGAAYLYAGASNGTDTRVVVSEPIAIQPEGCRDAYNNYSVVITLKEGETLVIGSKNIGELSARWVMIDNFKLEYCGPNSEKEESSADPTAIESVATSTVSAPAAIYTISGAKVSSLKKGINIVRMADGQVKKVFVK